MSRYNIPQKFQILNGNVLKSIACIAMLLDHAAACIIYQALYVHGGYFYYGMDLDELQKIYNVFHTIGRIAFPIFAFLLVEGFFHTKNRMKYALRLLIWGIVSEIPFNLCIFFEVMHPALNNVLFTLLLGFLAIWAWEKFQGRWYIQLPLCALMFVAARQLNTDYRWRGVLLIFIFYLLRKWRIPQLITGLISMYWEFPGVIMAFVLLLFYNGKRGRQLKYFFYMFYPIHLILLYLIVRFCIKCF